MAIMSNLEVVRLVSRPGSNIMYGEYILENPKGNLKDQFDILLANSSRSLAELKYKWHLGSLR